MTVEAGKTYRVRMINAGSLAFLSVCFAGHSVTVVAADAYPVEPLPVQCVDINLGQRCAPGWRAPCAAYAAACQAPVAVTCAHAILPDQQCMVVAHAHTAAAAGAGPGA